MKKAVDVTVSIVNWNTKDELRECLKTLITQVGVRFEIAVVDNNSSDNSVEMLREEFANKVGVIANASNIGFGAGHNMVVEPTDSRFIFVLNPDTRLTDNHTLHKMVAYMDQHPNIGVLAPKVLDPDGSVQYSVRRFPNMIAAAFRQTAFGKLFPNNPFVKKYLMTDFEHNKTADVDWASGCAMLIRRAAINEIGDFDEGFFMYCEDIDLCRRMQEDQWRVVYFPEVKVIHKIGAASDQNPIPMIKQHHKSMLRYFIKYNLYSPQILLLPLVVLGLTFRSFSLTRRVKR